MNRQYDDCNRGVLFINDRKESDSQPDRKGSINIDGKEYWLSAWNKQTSRGDTISLNVKAKDAGQAKAASAKQAASGDPDDDLPF